jgi:hypothetical protein|tara:strand:+ start:1030 stop:1293 length:264 start_codon:yes stop_codon:yes gene_type:complete
MDIKSIVLNEITKQIESSVPSMKDGIEDLIIQKIQSEEFEEKWASEINKKINLPFLNEEQEQKVFETIIDKGTDVFAAVLKQLLKKA